MVGDDIVGDRVVGCGGGVVDVIVGDVEIGGCEGEFFVKSGGFEFDFLVFVDFGWYIERFVEFVDVGGEVGDEGVVEIGVGGDCGEDVNVGVELVVDFVGVVGVVVVFEWC